MQPGSEPPGGDIESEYKREEGETRGRADVLQRPPDDEEEEGGQSRKEEAAQPLLLSH